jgi:DNA topoisomerase-1
VLLAEPAAERRRGAPQPLRELGTHPEGGVVALFQGRYGPYVSHNGVFASLPREADPDAFSLEQAIPLLDERRKNSPRQRKSTKRGASKPKAAAKASTRKSAKAPAAASIEQSSTAKAKRPTKAKAKAKRPASAKAAPAKKKAASGRPATRPRSRAGTQPG